MASSRTQTIEQLLRETLDAVHVEVVDDSARHAGHLGAEGGAGHFQVLVVSPQFIGLSRVEAHRLVYRALVGLMASDIHALEMRTLTPEDWEASRHRG
jgi:BolA protein